MGPGCILRYRFRGGGTRRCDSCHSSILETNGEFAEPINWVTRYFIPTGLKAKEVLGRIVTAKPIAEAVRIRG
jgi:hypothetical protein